jgi:hypothetical protein
VTSKVRKLWSWHDYRYPAALAAALVALTALIGVVGLFQSNDQRGSQIIALNSDSQCRSGLATKVDVALLDAFDWVIKHPSTGSPEEAAARQHLLVDIETARAERASTPTTCNASGTTALPPATTIPPPVKASTP